MNFDFGQGWEYPNGNSNSIYLIKVSPGSALAWKKLLKGGSGYEKYSGGVALDDANSIALVGTFNGSIDFGGGTLEAPGSAARASIAVTR
jgi:hypothetical protein